MPDSLSQMLAPHLPFLRRYARALTGGQKSGDAYVRACLQAIVNEPSAIQRDIHPKVALYRLFHAIWSGTQVGGDAELDGISRQEATAQQRLAAMTPESRQALLLSVVEGFSDADTAAVMDVPVSEVQPLIAKAMAEIDRQTRTRVLIIEDEPMISMDLSGIVQELGHEVAAIARTRTEAVAAAGAEQPGLVLADIQLADGSSGIDAVKDILSGFSVPVIFITAFPQRLLTGERPEPTFLLTKPFDPRTVKAAISQALFFNSTASMAA
ncbi:response regulator [Kaistia geumhonensis]|uniref:DNA-directed RNA polymerase specialized sigma24 family protein n=1 Tax=Kaistia geumhonensis TaxID=410839 RepID=A0ABU0M643_9HYPH|nr:response regulator [Kaistia geumhonensis]MCX5478357.1 response regulator [Kaistia geumhonensis]MDQ0516425.1 DNA-directed RNA polymerase specialized sigma24 family protein [Kaistia geumhonensis]